MELQEWARRVEFVSAGYGDYYDVRRSPDWALLKLTEEVGELVQAWLTASGQGRDRGQDAQQRQAALEGEVADVLGMVLVVAGQTGVDVERAMADKWLAYEQFHQDRQFRPDRQADGSGDREPQD